MINKLPPPGTRSQNNDSAARPKLCRQLAWWLFGRFYAPAQHLVPQRLLVATFSTKTFRRCKLTFEACFFGVRRVLASDISRYPWAESNLWCQLNANGLVLNVICYCWNFEFCLCALEEAFLLSRWPRTLFSHTFGNNFYSSASFTFFDSAPRFIYFLRLMFFCTRGVY